MEEAKTRKLTSRFKITIVYWTVVIVTNSLNSIFPWWPQPSLGDLEISLGIGILMSVRTYTKGLLTPKTTPFYDVKAAIEEFRNRKLPWETP